MIKTLNCSIFKNLTTLLHGPIILINSNDTKLISKKLKNIKNETNKQRQYAGKAVAECR